MTLKFATFSVELFWIVPVIEVRSVTLDSTIMFEKFKIMIFDIGSLESDVKFSFSCAKDDSINEEINKRVTIITKPKILMILDFLNDN